MTHRKEQAKDALIQALAYAADDINDTSDERMGDNEHNFRSETADVDVTIIAGGQR